MFYLTLANKIDGYVLICDYSPYLAMYRSMLTYKFCNVGISFLVDSLRLVILIIHFLLNKGLFFAPCMFYNVLDNAGGLVSVFENVEADWARPVGMALPLPRLPHPPRRKLRGEGVTEAVQIFFCRIFSFCHSQFVSSTFQIKSQK